MLLCDTCKKNFDRPAGWGLDETCPDCFLETLTGFIDEIKDCPEVEKITVDVGDTQIIIKDAKAK